MKGVVMLIRIVDWLFITSERGVRLILLFCLGWGVRVHFFFIRVGTFERLKLSVQR